MDNLCLGDARLNKIGQLVVPSRVVVAIDPCYYDIHLGCKFTTNQPQLDIWVYEVNCGSWGWRPARLILTYEGKKPTIHDTYVGLVSKDKVVGVDSAHASFWDRDNFENLSLGWEWFERDTPTFDFNNNLKDWGRTFVIACLAGYGDGVYSVYETVSSLDMYSPKQWDLVFINPGEENWADG